MKFVKILITMDIIFYALYLNLNSSKYIKTYIFLEEIKNKKFYFISISSISSNNINVFNKCHYIFATKFLQVCNIECINKYVSIHYTLDRFSSILFFHIWLMILPRQCVIYGKLLLIDTLSLLLF